MIQAFFPSLRSIPTIVPLNRVLASRMIVSSSVVDRIFFPSQAGKNKAELRMTLRV